MFNFSVAVLTANNDAMLDEFLSQLYDSINDLKNFENSLVTLRKRIHPYSAATDVILNDLKGENLIFFVSSQVIQLENFFSEEQRIAIENGCPALKKLLFCNPYGFSERCFLNRGSLVYQILSHAEYKELLQHQLPILFEAASEVGSLKHDFVLKISNASCGFLQKSVVSLMSVANRPRASPYSMISVNEALNLVLNEAYCLGKVEKRLKNSSNHILAECIKAPEPYPPFQASVKDGYAVIASDPAFESLPAILSVVGNAEMGSIPKFEVTFGTCARVSTGGVIPDSATAVIQVEDTEVYCQKEGEELSIAFLKKPKLLQDIRKRGSDIPEESTLVAAGQKISSSEIGILSIFGVRSVTVFQKPWVAIMSSGNEVSDPDDPLLPGCIRDSNKNTLSAMLRANHIPVVDVGIAKDNPHSVKSHLYLALSSADIIISTGGVSMGEKDIMKEVLKKDFGATFHFGRVHVKPGKPTTFSTVEFGGTKKFIFSLPGNPVSACVCFYLFVVPCIKKMMGYEFPEHKPIKVKLGRNLKLDERPEFCRASLNQGSDGVFVATTTGDQQSSRLLSMQNCDALLVLPAKSQDRLMLEAGTLVEAVLLQTI